MPSDSNEPQTELTRRQFLQAAGGVTFLALVPLRAGAFVATFAPRSESAAPLPTFTALPYLQPGTTGSKLVSKQEAMVVAWQTNGVPATFDVEYGPTSGMGKKATVHKQERLSADHAEGDRRFNYNATLSGLELNKRYYYRVRMNGENYWKVT